METYKAFGLIIQSELTLPYLQPIESRNHDLEIVWGSVEEKGLDNPIHIGRFSQTKPNQLWLHIPGIARFLVTGGSRIQIEPDVRADEQSIRLYVLGSCMGAIMHQRGQLILHGSTLRFGNHCAVLAGNSGTGKSTLAAALYLRGHEILADDLAVVDDEGRVQPGIPQIKLWADAIKKLVIDSDDLTRIRMQVDKYAYPLKKNFCDAPLPIMTVYILHTHNKADVLFEPVYGMGKFNPLKNHTYRFSHIKGLGLQARHLQLCGQLANRVRVVHITRPMAKFALDEMVELVESDLQLSTRCA